MEARFRKVGFLSVLLFLGVHAGWGEVTVSTQPRQVTVFPDSARVVREGSLKLEAGPEKVLFPDLPASVIESSIRLTVDGPPGTKLFGVELRKEYTPEVAEERTRVLKNQIQSLEDERTAFTDRVDARKTEMDILKGLAKESASTAACQGATHAGTIVDFTRSAGAVGARIAKLMLASRKDERGIRNLDLKLAALRKQLSEGGSPDREKKTASADLELAQPGIARFTLTYQVSQAGWTPLYDLRLNTTAEKPQMDLVFNAGVRQKTGEDWNGVALTLSTSRPTEGTQVPDPTDWWLDFFNHEVFRAKKLMGMAAYAPAPASSNAALYEEKNDDSQDASLEAAQVETAQTIQAPYAMSFSIPTHKDIPSDGSDHRVEIAENSHPVALTLVAVPRLSQAAYLEAKITYGGEQSLLPGQAQLFRDGDFVGTTYLEAKAPGEAFDLGFGQDDQIRVERKMVNETTGQAGFLFTKGERKYDWVTTLVNYHSGVRTVEVREQLPRSHQKQITVEKDNISPKPQPENPDKPGLVCWKLELTPKEKTKLTFAYHVNFPEDMQISGLE